MAERVVALCALDPGSEAVRALVEATARRAIRHQRGLGAIRAAGREGRCVLWEIVP